MEQSTTPSLEHEVTRILTSNTSKQIVTQLKAVSQADLKIEQQLRNKTMQISQLQNYLKSQIENIQGIVDANKKLKKELAENRVEMERLRRENEAGERQLELVVGNNKKYGEELAMLERRNIELMTQVRDLKNGKNNGMKKVVQVCVQTEEQITYKNGINRSSNTSPQCVKHNQAKLLQKISQLQQTVVALKLEKSQLQSKINQLNNLNQSQPNTSQLQESSCEEPSEQTQQFKSTAEVLQLICQDQLIELKFRGEIVNGLKEGRGVCLYQDRIHYEGHFHQGKRHGLGTLYMSQQQIYRGYWFNGLIQGKGILRMLEGQIQTYEGQFFQGRLEGYGCMSLKSGKRVLGFWQEGRIKGNCMEADHTGKRYTKPELIHCY